MKDYFTIECLFGGKYHSEYYTYCVKDLGFWVWNLKVCRNRDLIPRRTSEIKKLHAVERINCILSEYASLNPFA